MNSAPIVSFSYGTLAIMNSDWDHREGWGGDNTVASVPLFKGQTPIITKWGRTRLKNKRSDWTGAAAFVYPSKEGRGKSNVTFQCHSPLPGLIKDFPREMWYHKLQTATDNVEYYKDLKICFKTVKIRGEWRTGSSMSFKEHSLQC